MTAVSTLSPLTIDERVERIAAHIRDHTAASRFVLCDQRVKAGCHDPGRCANCSHVTGVTCGMQDAPCEAWDAWSDWSDSSGY